MGRYVSAADDQSGSQVDRPFCCVAVGQDNRSICPQMVELGSR